MRPNTLTVRWSIKDVGDRIEVVEEIDQEDLHNVTFRCRDRAQADELIGNRQRAIFELVHHSAYEAAL